MGGRTTPVVQCFPDQAAEQAFLGDPAYGTIPGPTTRSLRSTPRTPR